MRKIFNLFIILGSLFLITSCVAETESKTIHRVTFDPDNGAEQFYVEVEDGMTVDVPTDPEKEDHQFLGWYKEGKLFDFATQITESINLIATYEQIVFHYNVEFYDTGDSNIKNQTVRHMIKDMIIVKGKRRILIINTKDGKSFVLHNIRNAKKIVKTYYAINEYYSSGIKNL